MSDQEGNAGLTIGVAIAAAVVACLLIVLIARTPRCRQVRDDLRRERHVEEGGPTTSNGTISQDPSNYDPIPGRGKDKGTVAMDTLGEAGLTEDDDQVYTVPGKSTTSAGSIETYDTPPVPGTEDDDQVYTVPSKSVDDDSVYRAPASGSAGTMDAYDTPPVGAVTSGGSRTGTGGAGDKHVIAAKDLKLGAVLAEGAYGRVRKGKWRNVTVAVKELKTMEAEPRRQLLAESVSLAALRNHPNVVPFYGMVLDPFMVVLAYRKGGALETALYGKSARTDLTMDKLNNILLGAAKGLAHLHAEGIIHRDLAARNVLLDKHDEACLTDFGMSRINDDGDEDGPTTTVSTTGPIKWMAPEQLEDHVYSTKSDIWSLGVLCCEIYGRSPPWKKVSNVKAATIVLGGAHHDIPADTPSKVASLMKEMFKHDAADRPSAQTIVENLDAFLGDD
jgi:hypothetical protein